MFLQSRSFAVSAKNKNRTLLFYWQPAEPLVFALLPVPSAMGTCGLLGQIYEVNSHFWEVSCHQQPGTGMSLRQWACQPRAVLLGKGRDQRPHHITKVPSSAWHLNCVWVDEEGKA